MQKIKIRLPATITNFGPGVHSLGLALGLHTTVEISGRDDAQLVVELQGEGADQFEDTYLRHPLIVAISRFFQRIERTKLGFNVRVQSNIPLGSGLGAETAFAVAGVLGANNLMGGLYDREELLEIAAIISRPDGATASLMGGLAAAVLDDDETLHYRSLPVQPFQVVIVLPELADYTPPDLPDEIERADALFNMGRIPLVAEALRQGDRRLLLDVLDDRLYIPQITSLISGYGHVVELARRRGAQKVIPCGNGPALLALGEGRLERLAEEMVLAFKSTGVEARSWVLPIDTQGVVISIAQSV